MNYSVGDIVTLITAGPEMVVGKIENNGDVTCYWYNATDDAIRIYIFPSVVLRKV